MLGWKKVKEKRVFSTSIVMNFFKKSPLFKKSRVRSTTILGAILPGTERAAPTKQTNKQTKSLRCICMTYLQVTPMISCHDTDWSGQRVRQASACWEGLRLISGRGREGGGVAVAWPEVSTSEWNRGAVTLWNAVKKASIDSEWIQPLSCVHTMSYICSHKMCSVFCYSDLNMTEMLRCLLLILEVSLFHDITIKCLSDTLSLSSWGFVIVSKCS